MSSEFIFFKKFITPAFITIIYLLGALFITIASIVLIGAGASVGSSYGVDGGGMAVLWGFLMLILGNIMWRIWCEYLIVQFRMYDALVSIDHKLTPVGAKNT